MPNSVLVGSLAHVTPYARTSDLSSVRRRTDSATQRRVGSAPRDQRATVMNFLIWLVVGGMIGWAASTVMRTPENLNVVVGIVGAALGGWLLSPLVGVSTVNPSSLSVPSLLVSVLGAIILLVIVHFVRPGVPR